MALLSCFTVSTQQISPESLIADAKAHPDDGQIVGRVVGVLNRTGDTRLLTALKDIFQVSMARGVRQVLAAATEAWRW